MDGSNFMEKRIDPLIRIALSDLARTLANNASLEVDFAYHSYLDIKKNKMTISFFWDRLLDARKIDGMKTDVYLRSFGQAHFTSQKALDEAIFIARGAHYPSLFKQLTALSEEFRVMELAQEARPGMLPFFQTRLSLLIRYYRERFHYHLSRTEWMNALFCAFYLRLAGRPVGLSATLSPFSSILRDAASSIGLAKGTAGVVQVVKTLIEELPDIYSDMSASYYTIRGMAEFERMENPVKNANALVSEASKKLEQNKETYEESLPTWHQEQKQEGDNFLQFDLDEGSKTDLIGEGERKMESGDQAFASVQGEGASRANNNNQFDDMPSVIDNENMDSTQGGGGVARGINRGVVARKAVVKPPSAEDKKMYAMMRNSVEPSVRSLKRSIEKWLEHKKTAPKSDLHVGRLGKKLTRLVTEENPRLFYKKHSEDKSFDAVFSLLVDCSASMHDKMNEVKKGLILFHEALRSLGVRHAVTGFWEDALSSDAETQPNFFIKPIEFERSTLPSVGSRLLQLTPEEDNRDGFSIRVAADELSKRSEAQKWLLVFTDGEPSAYGYTDSGIVDTHEAVRAARKMGIRVVGVFLSGAETAEDELVTMKDIYGRESLIIPTVEDIPLYIAPMLRKMLTSE